MPSYEWCETGSVTAPAVVVTVWRSVGRTVADVTCTAGAPAGASGIADFPRPVPAALHRAEQVRRASGLERTVVVLADRSLWRPDWGQLQPVMACA